MTLRLTRRHCGDYMLTHERPIIERVRGTRHEDAYLAAGEPIGVQHLCEGGVRALFGVELPPLSSVRVELSGTVL